MAAEDSAGAFLILNMESKGGIAAGSGEQGKAAVDVHLGHEKCSKELAELGCAFLQFYHHEITGGKGDFFGGEKILDATGVAYDQADDGGIRGILDADGEDLDVVLV